METYTTSLWIHTIKVLLTVFSDLISVIVSHITKSFYSTDLQKNINVWKNCFVKSILRGRKLFCCSEDLCIVDYVSFRWI